MNLYLISQSKAHGYDTYDSAVVCAKSEEDARKIHPGGADFPFNENGEDSDWSNYYASSWCRRSKDVDVELIGTATKDQIENSVICASFNAG